MSWRDRAQCKDTDTEAFYLGDVGGRSGIDGYRPALPVVTEYCRPCPVKAECLEDAIATGDWWGIRGGLSAEQRKALQRRDRRQANSVASGADPLKTSGRIGAAPGGASTPSEGLAQSDESGKSVPTW